MVNKNPRLPKKPGTYFVCCLDTLVFKSLSLIIKYSEMQCLSVAGEFQVLVLFQKAMSCCSSQIL